MSEFPVDSLFWPDDDDSHLTGIQSPQKLPGINQPLLPLLGVHLDINTVPEGSPQKIDDANFVNAVIVDEQANQVSENANFQITIEHDAAGKNPAMDNFKGCHNFDIGFDENKGGAAWNYSIPIDKLYIKMDTKIQMSFKCEASEFRNLYVRALPVFLDSNSFTKPVMRCYSHSNPQDKINQGYTNATQHIIRIDDQRAVYEHNEESGRFSVVVPLGPKQTGTEKVYKPLSFMCQNSCLGMKCPVAVIFTLEDEFRRVLGRRTLNVKVCSGPNRDRKIEERTLCQVRDKKTKKRKGRCAEEDKSYETINIPNTILKAVVSYSELRLKEYCEEENRKPDETEKQCLKQYAEILETLRQKKKPKTTSNSDVN